MKSKTLTSFTKLVVITIILITLLTCQSNIYSDISFLNGHTIATYNFHGITPDQTVVFGPEFRQVGPGVELTNFGWSGFVNVDFSDTNILITATIDQPSGFSEVLRFVDENGTIPPISAVTVNPATNWSGFDASRIQFNADLIDLNLTSLQGLQGQRISLDLEASGGGGGSIFVTAPQGGEMWQIKRRQRITWTSNNAGGNVKIELSRDGGTTYEAIFDSTPNDGKQRWKPRRPPTTQAIIKISSVGTPSINDTSNSTFTIFR